MVVDALDLCYTKGHVDTFVIISGDSDFSPLVAKLRENNKLVIGVGVKESTSDLLTAACDEFIFYDDLALEAAQQKRAAKKRAKDASRPAKPKKKEEEEPEDRSQMALDLALETIEALQAERGEEERIWGSMVKQALKRRKPGFNEAHYGFRSFSALLEEAGRRGLLRLERDERSGGYVVHQLPEDE
jgi:ABC-type branched-subunit amino acid transport system substrate-binding protein